MLFFLTFLLAATLLAADPIDVTPRVGVIEVYGARKVPLQKIAKALAIRPGDPLPSREDAEDRINKVGNILASRVEAVCCSGNNMVLYVGVEERDAPHMEFHGNPGGTVALAPSLMSNYRRFLDEVEDSLRAKNADEDLTSGYSLMADPDCRSIQTSFLGAVAADLPNLASVVRESASFEQRAAAAYLLQYAPRGPRTTPVMVDGIQWALQDEDDAVRSAAIHSLRAVLVGAKLHPDQEIHFEATWLVALMNSLVWSDRMHASEALVVLTESSPQALDLVRARALAAVLEMARWQDLKSALPAFMLAGRLAGLPDEQIKKAWMDEDREAVLKAAAGKRSDSKHPLIHADKRGKTKA